MEQAEIRVKHRQGSESRKVKSRGDPKTELVSTQTSQKYVLTCKRPKLTHMGRGVTENLNQGCQTRFPGGRSVCWFLWFPFNQLSIKARGPRRVHSLANQLLEWTKGAEIFILFWLCTSVHWICRVCAVVWNMLCVSGTEDQAVIQLSSSGLLVYPATGLLLPGKKPRWYRIGPVFSQYTTPVLQWRLHLDHPLYGKRTYIIQWIQLCS